MPMARLKENPKPYATILASLTITVALLVTLPLTYFIFIDLLPFGWLPVLTQAKSRYVLLQNRSTTTISHSSTETVATVTSKVYDGLLLTTSNAITTDIPANISLTTKPFSTTTASTTDYRSEKPLNRINSTAVPQQHYTNHTDNGVVDHESDYRQTSLPNASPFTSTMATTSPSVSSTLSSTILLPDHLTTTSYFVNHNTGLTNYLNNLTTDTPTTTAAITTSTSVLTTSITSKTSVFLRLNSSHLNGANISTNTVPQNNISSIALNLPSSGSTTRIYNIYSKNSSGQVKISKLINNDDTNTGKKTQWNVVDLSTVSRTPTPISKPSTKPVSFTSTPSSVPTNTAKMLPSNDSSSPKHQPKLYSNSIVNRLKPEKDSDGRISSINNNTNNTRNYWKTPNNNQHYTTSVTPTIPSLLMKLPSSHAANYSALTRGHSTQRHHFDYSNLLEHNNQHRHEDIPGKTRSEAKNPNLLTKHVEHNAVDSRKLYPPHYNNKIFDEIDNIPTYTTTPKLPSVAPHPAVHHRQNQQHRFDHEHKHNPHKQSNDNGYSGYGHHNQQHSNHIHTHYGEHDYYDISSAIVVTALFDIGRGDWYKYTRSYEQYLEYLDKLLKLKNRIVIYTDYEGAKYVRSKRHHKNTQIFEMTLQQIPLYRYRQEMKQIIDSEQNNWNYDHAMKDHPESKSVDYDIVVNSKAYFVYNATKHSKFRHHSKYFVWIDAGYGHADKTVVPADCHWKPPLPDGFITVIKITPDYDKIERYSINDLYRVDWSVISGGFFGGDIATIDRFYRFYHKTFLDLLDEKKVDDDQTTLTIAMKNYPNLFYTLHSNGDWFALFKFFPC